MFFLFFMLFFFLSLSSFFLSFYFLDGESFSLEVFFPFSFLLEMPIIFCVDYFSLLFFSSISLISSVVFLFSGFYIYNNSLDGGKVDKRFFFLLFFFVVSMMFLVFSGSWVVVLLGWDGLGLVSFLLVVYYNNSSSLDSGLLTVFTNRLGDCFFLLSFMFFFYSGWKFFDFLSFSSSWMMFFFICLGCVTKSAQVPFSSWLPAAMAAPTPVSSLVHSSTLVTAGIYLFIRFGHLVSSFYFYFSVLSLFTMVLAGLCACVELDFKKVVAMSTLSQLGFMLFSICCGLWGLAFCHLLFHAFFKSSLFLSTGSLMHYLSGGQDSRFFGSLGMSFFSKLFFLVSSLSLMGFPFSLGFYSKDFILGLIIFNQLSLSSFFFYLGCMFTVCYSIRLVKMGFSGYPSFFSFLVFSDSPLFYLPLIFLFISCTFAGDYFFFNLFPLNMFSFLESFFGILIILGGFVMSFFSFSGYFFSFYFMDLGFLSSFSSTFFSSFLLKLSTVAESTWGELTGPKVVSVLPSYFFFNFSEFYFSKYTFLAPLGGAFFLCFYL